MKNKNGNLFYGEDSTENEFCLIGDEASLKALRSAIDCALEKGQFEGKGLGEFKGVKKFSSDFFDDKGDTEETSDFIGIVISVAFVAIIIFAIVGIVSAAQWAIG